MLRLCRQKQHHAETKEARSTMMAEPLRKLGSSVRLGYAPYAKQRIYPPDLISDLSVTCSLAQRRERRQRFMADG
jgi:hypothetical protein